MFDELVTFIDNSDNRIVVEVDAEWAESKFMSPIMTEEGNHLGYVWTERLLTHMGLGLSWFITREEYTGDTYIVTIEKMFY